MVYFIRNSMFSKVLWGIMCVYLLNLSADTTDPYPRHFAEDLSINDQESIVEIVIEQILGYENAIKEYDDNDTADHHKKGDTKTVFMARYTTETKSFLNFEFNIPARQFQDYSSLLLTGFHQLDTPPPKV